MLSWICHVEFSSTPQKETVLNLKRSSLLFVVKISIYKIKEISYLFLNFVSRAPYQNLVSSPKITYIFNLGKIVRVILKINVPPTKQTSILSHKAYIK